MSEYEAKTSGSHPIRVDFLPPEELGLSGRLGITFAPGKKVDGADGRWERNLETDLRRLGEEYGAEVLVSLMESSEYGDLGIPNLFRQAEGMGMEVLHLPIPDGGVPLEDPESNDYEASIRDIADRLRGGRTVVVHCRGGQGRSGLVAASILVFLGCPAVKALEVVRKTRKGAVETPEQEERVHFFELELGAKNDTQE